MPRTAPQLSIALPPRRRSSLPAYQWLGDALRAEILAGRLRPGARIPATRDLARDYGLSRGTVVAAFEQLRAQGYVSGTPGSGTYVSDVLPDDLLHVRAPAAVSPLRPKTRTVARAASALTPFPDVAFRRTRAFRTDLPALNLFPTDVWAHLASRRLRRATSRQLLGCPPMGHRPLQEAVADYLRTSRGVNTSAEQVAIVSGTQEALDLVARLLLEPRDRVCMENPGYVGARLVFEAHGIGIVPLAVDGEGVQVPKRKLRAVKLAYVTPAHQFPLGVTMSLSRRLELLEWAHGAGAMVFEDDYDSEFRYSGRPLPALQGLDTHGVVLHSGTFSKVMFPALRLGYLVLPPDLVERFAAIKSVINRHAPVLEQTVLTDFITTGHFGRHVRRMREAYAERLQVLLTSARERLGGVLEISEIEAGLQIVGRLRGRHRDAEAVARAAAGHDVEITPLSRFALAPLPELDGAIHLGFAAVDPSEIRRGISDLATAIDGMGRRRR